MSWQPISGIVRILGPEETTQGTGTGGTGFIVGGNGSTLIATCAHVIQNNVGAEPGDTVQVEVGAANESAPPTVIATRVEPDYWREPDAEDVAFLRPLDPLPAGFEPLTLATLVDEARPHKAWGYPFAKATTGLAAEVSQFAPNSEGGFPVLSARSEEASYGFSGAPVWDYEADVVVGMVTSIVPRGTDPAGRQETTVFLRPTEQLWRVCPSLRTAGANPYHALEVFAEEDADDFHGRSNAIEKLLQRLGECDFVAVVGVSGSGKSSLVRAGLRKGLDAAPIVGLAEKPRCRFRPGSAPALDLILAVQGVVQPNPVEPALGFADFALRDEPETRRAVADEIQQRSARELALSLRDVLSAGAIVVVDQFERIFTECRDGDAREHFAEVLLELASEDVKVVIAFRADFYGRVLEVPTLGPAVERGQVTVLPMTEEELLAAIVRPARARNRKFEPGLPERLVADVLGRAGDLPLLELALSELWERDAETGLLRKQTYDDLGAVGPGGEAFPGVRGAIARRAEQFWETLDPEERKSATRIFLNLVAPVRLGAQDGSTVAEAARQAWQLEWDEETFAVADKLVRARLLTTGQDATTGAATVEVAHEALIRAWPRLQRLATKHLDFISWYARDFAPWLRRWEMNDKSPDLVLPGALLDAASTWATSSAELLTSAAAEFIAASVDARTQQEERERQERAREQERIHALRVSESLRLASEARQASTSEPETALLVAWEAVLCDRNELSEAVFRETLTAAAGPVTMLWGPREGSLAKASVGFAADGNRLLAASGDGIVARWDVSGAGIGYFQVPGDGTLAAVAMAGGTRLVTYRDGVIRLHRLDGEVLDQFQLEDVPASPARNLTLSASATTKCLVQVEERGWLFDVGSRDRDRLTLERPLAFVSDDWEDVDTALHYPGSTVWKATLSVGGDLLMTEASDGAYVWTVSGAPRARLLHESVASARFLADDRIVTGTLNGRGELWTTTGTSIDVFKQGGGGRDLFVPAVGPDATYFAATVNQSKVVEVWSGEGELLATLPGHEGHVWSAAFSHDGHYLACGSEAGALRVWDWRAERIVLDLHAQAATTHQVIFHPRDGGMLAAAYHDGSVRLWSLEASPIPPLRGHEQAVDKLARAYGAVVSSGSDRTARVWRSPEAVDVLPGKFIDSMHEADVGHVALTTDEKATVRVWELGQADNASICRCEFRIELSGPRVAIASDGTQFIFVEGSNAELWSCTGERIRSLIGADSPGVDEGYRRICGAGFRRDGTRIVTAAENGMVWLWAQDGTPVRSFVADHSSPDRIFDVALDPRGEYIATGVRKPAKLWNWDGELQYELPSRGYKVWKVAFTPDGARIITVADNPSGRPSAIAELWTRTGDLIEVLKIPKATTSDRVSFDPNCRYFCIHNESAATIVDFAGVTLGTLAASRGTRLMDVNISADGSSIAASFTDGMVRIWGFSTRRRTMTLPVVDARRILFTADGRRLLAAKPSGLIEQHALDVADLYPAAAKRVTRVLTPDEIERFAIQEPRLRLADVEADAAT